MTHIVTITGPSLSGKTQLSKILQEDYDFNAVVSVTTRPQRANEKDGIDYYFISKERFDEMFNEMKFIQTTHFNNYLYGVSVNEVIGKNDAPIVWVVAPESISQIENYCNENNVTLTKVFVTNPEEILYERLLERFKNDSVGNVQTYVKRLQSMTNIEKQWSIDALHQKIHYDIVIEEFNKDNTSEKVNDVVWHIKKKNEETSAMSENINIALNNIVKPKMK